MAAHQSGEEDAEELRKLKAMRETADYVTDSSHPEVQDVFAENSISDWAGLATRSLSVAGALIPRLRTMAPVG